MQLGMIGLGRMGSAMVRRLVAGGHACVVHDVHAERRSPRRCGRASPARATLAELVGAARQAARRLADGARCGRRRGARAADPAARRRRHRHRRRQLVLPRRSSAARDALKSRGIHYVDVGTSGGVAGLERGYCLMIGGESDDRRAARPDLRHACARRRSGAAHAGPRDSATPPSTGTCIAARTARATSSRWSTTASSTG